MGSEFVDEVVHVNEKEVDVFNLLLAFTRLGTLERKLK